jgi:predicted negative regulator of RcsB-dependent stress response
MSSSHLTRKDLKNDLIDHEVQVGVKYVTSHRDLLTKAAIGVGVLLVAAGGYMYYSNTQAATREKALLEARRVMVATVGTPAKAPNLSFPTQEEKDKATAAAYTKLANDYPGSVEAAIGQLYLAAAKADKGELDGAISDYRQVIDKAPKQFASTAKLALGQILWSQGKVDEGKKLLEEIVANPTEFVSAEQAKLTMARLQLHSNPAEARKILDSLTKERSAVSTVAVELMGQLPPATN